MKTFRILPFLSLFLATFTPTASSAPRHVVVKPSLTIAIQPLGRVAPQLVEQVRRGLLAAYKAKVQVLPVKPLSPSTLSSRAGMYRAEKILYEMDRDVRPSFTKVIALTSREIAATKGRQQNYSISGYGLISQRPCVVSTYKIRRKKGSEALFQKRLIKIAIHEVGHTLGLPHCPNDECLMADMKGSLRGLDRRTGAFCASCRKKIGIYLQNN